MKVIIRRDRLCSGVEENLGGLDDGVGIWAGWMESIESLWFIFSFWIRILIIIVWVNIVSCAFGYPFGFVEVHGMNERNGKKVNN